jgi:hypothetical protein
MATNTPPRKRRGCPYVARKLPEWEARYPLLGLASSLLNLRAQFVRQGSIDLTARQAGQSDKSLLPRDIAVHPEALEEIYNISPSQITGYQRVRDDVYAVESHLYEAMPDQGWEWVNGSETDDSRVLVWKKGDSVCHTELVPVERATEIWLRCTLTTE